jgi:hypothetical protein
LISSKTYSPASLGAACAVRVVHAMDFHLEPHRPEWGDPIAVLMPMPD